ncbi:hypothetical protein LTR85_002018 [Meristemomyces frigidus]|nr:hypothetical protein LTR85_002018 [Meristemomyces frigidus]
MDSTFIEQVPLSTVYLQIGHADTPSAALGIGGDASESDIRDTYRALALRIHPDKAPSDHLRELHTSLFQKLQAAYNELLDDDFDQSGDAAFTAPKRLPETLASLHARNAAFQEALRRERERALSAKQAADARHVAKQANVKARNERLAGKREARSQMLQREQEKRAKEIEKRSKQVAQSLERTEERAGQGPEAPKRASDQSPLDWEQEEERLEAEAEQRKALTAQTKGQSRTSKPKRPLQNKPTEETARPMWDDAVDERLVSDAEIRGRWDKSLLSGGRSGSVSLSQKKQKAHSAAARIHKYNMALCEEADHMVKRALTGNRTFSALVEEEMMEMAFVGAETKAEARTERLLQVMDGEVVDRYLLEDGEQGRGTALGSLAIKSE